MTNTSISVWIEILSLNFRIPDICIDRLQNEFKQLDCTDKQKDRMEEFFRYKRAIGELKQDDLVNICELGQGNGGVVWKVRHKPTNKIMARKVHTLLSIPPPRTKETHIACFACIRKHCLFSIVH